MAPLDRDTVIYGLLDPESKQLRYIGKTCKPIAQRYDGHISTARRNDRNGHCQRWLRGLLARGLKPEMVVIETIAGGGDWQEAETFWIASVRMVGAELTNHTIGGEGLAGHRHSEESKARMSEKHKGKVIPESLKKKWSESKKGKPTKPVSQETREKISLAQKGKPRLYARGPMSEESKAAKSRAAIRRYSDPLERQRTSEARKAFEARKLENGTAWLNLQK